MTDPLVEAVILFAVGFAGGFIGALTGLGGAAVSTPILTGFLDVPIRVAIGSSIMITIANSSTGGANYLVKGLANLRVGYSLAIATIIGSMVGVILNLILPVKALYIVFGLILLVAPLPGLLRGASSEFVRVHKSQDRISSLLGLRGSYYDENKRATIEYKASKYPQAFIAMTGAGAIAGLLGIGAGAFKVLSMDYIMGLPFKVSAATSSFIIGLTASAAGVQYVILGYTDPVIVSLLVPGVIAGSYASSIILNKLPSKTLRIIFTLVVWTLALQMILRGLQNAA